GGVDEHGERYPIPDPRAAECQALVAERHGLGRRLLGVETVFGPAVRPSAAFVEAFERLYDSLRRHGVSETLRQVLGE
ncbi:mannitol dehydrogenase family protein, partial [Pseudomonas aeruginosa]